MHYSFPILSFCYGLVASIRNLLYDEHVLYSHRPSIPTVCVGNLAVGGTGKTPHVEYLLRVLLERGFHPAVLSRGYKRRTAGFVLADANSSADKIGDEPRQIKRKFPDVPVAVCEDRVRGVRKLRTICPTVDVILLDDAFQHRRIRCGFNILLTPADRLYVDDSMLPGGRLREPKHGALRANLIVVTKCSPQMQPIARRIISTNLHPAAFQKVAFSSLRYEAPRPVFDSVTPVPVSSYFLLSGIAQPQYLRNYLGDQLRGERVFADHHRYTSKEIDELIEAFRRSGADCILTTEKDAARLYDAGLISPQWQHLFYYIPIEVDFGNDTSCADLVLQYLSEQHRLPAR